MLITDSQVHIWGADTPQRPWPKRQAPHRPVPLGHQELLAAMDAAGVDRVVIVPPGWEGERNDLALAAAAEGPRQRTLTIVRSHIGSSAHMGYWPGRNYDNIESLLERGEGELHR